MSSVLELNRRAFVAGDPRPMVVLDAQPTLEQAQAAERELKQNRRMSMSEQGTDKTGANCEGFN